MKLFRDKDYHGTECSSDVSCLALQGRKKYMPVII